MMMLVHTVTPRMEVEVVQLGIVSGCWKWGKGSGFIRNGVDEKGKEVRGEIRGDGSDSKSGSRRGCD